MNLTYIQAELDKEKSRMIIKWLARLITVIIIVGMFASWMISLYFFATAMQPEPKWSLCGVVFVIIFCVTFAGSIICGYEGAVIVDSLERKMRKFFKNNQSSQSTPRPFDPWIQAPKVKKTEKKDDVPKIWEEKALA